MCVGRNKPIISCVNAKCVNTLAKHYTDLIVFCEGFPPFKFSIYWHRMLHQKKLRVDQPKMDAHECLTKSLEKKLSGKEIHFKIVAVN